MYKKNQGYGICGSKNIYSSSVRIDNWVEDNIGMQLGHTERPPFKLYSTVTKEAHCDPSQWPEPQNLPVNMPTPLELKTKNKDGMPYALLFEHNSNVPADVRASSLIFFFIKDHFTFYALLSVIGTFPNRHYENNESTRSTNFTITNTNAAKVESDY